MLEEKNVHSGGFMKVDPIKDLKHVKNIKKLLANSPRDRLLFIMGINSGMRVQDLLGLRVQDVRGLKLGDSITVKEQKTDKDNYIILNKEIKSALDAYLSERSHADEHYLFKSRKGRNYPLTTFRVTRLVKSWAEAVGAKGNFGAHTLRKTWTYQQRVVFKTSWEILAHRLNHSSPSITRRYLGVATEEVCEILMNTI